MGVVRTLIAPTPELRASAKRREKSSLVSTGNETAAAPMASAAALALLNSLSSMGCWWRNKPILLACGAASRSSETRLPLTSLVNV